MMHIVHRRHWAFALVMALMTASAGGVQAQDRKIAAQFDVSLGALTVGLFWIDGSTSSRAYTATAGFHTTGLVGGIAKVQMGMQSRGRVGDQGLDPDQYREEVAIGRQSSDLQIRYANGLPTITGAKFGTDDMEPVDPSTQGGTLDPLSATFDLLRDQSQEDLCDTDRFMFDGARRTRVTMTTLTRDGMDFLCSGQFRRLEGYTARELRRSGIVEVSVRYRLIEGDVTAVEASFTSLRGTLRLTRR